MRLILPNNVFWKLRYHMIRARKREIGGMIMGEQIDGQQFRIACLTIDTKTGTVGNFFRSSDEHEKALASFFDRTGNDYRRFNYLGEWHTHPSFSVLPSPQDISSMQGVVDGTGNVDFAMLFIARLILRWRIECSAHLFARGRTPTVVEVMREKKSI